MSDCLFCKIIAGKIPSHKIYEDGLAYVFLDIHPQSKGHALVIPKEHHRWVWDIPEIGPFYEVVRRVALAQRKALGVEQIISKVVGEEVPHAHVWLIPGVEAGAPRGYTYAEGEAESVATLIKTHLA
ncbi:MAG: hypothetical protein A2542_01165 [Parcubacteria group bacterium RIFOXYD2_FULL_52_8]|nr:MAG: hypothetical protein A2542_01165 [Parcubacteria group bacterium RIFOXYD2_FULL_52_8]